MKCPDLKSSLNYVALQEGKSKTVRRGQMLMVGFKKLAD